MTITFNAAFRKNIISFAWTWVGLLIFIGIMSLFSIWSMNHLYNDGAKSTQDNNLLENEALKAQIHFKIQVQEWKNTLLRGQKSEDKAKYFSKFEDQENKVAYHLRQSQKICATIHTKDTCQAIEIVRFEHEELGRLYRERLSQGSLENYEGMQKIDASVRGIDRSLEKDIDMLFSNFSKIKNEQVIKAKFDIENRYLILRKFVLIVLFISLSISGFSLYKILRSTKNQ
jgi:methyl-accepting chemotaxis protein